MNDPADFCYCTRLLKWNLSPIYFALLAFLLSSCTSRNPEPYSILEFNGTGQICNYSKSPFPVRYEADSANSTALLAENGDVIYYAESNCFHYRLTSQNKFTLKSIDGKGFINGKINSVHIPSNDDLIPFFSQMKSADFSDLGFLYLDSIVSDSYIPYLTDLAKIRPGIGVGYNGPLSDIKRILEIFNPGFVVESELYQKDFGLLSSLTRMEFYSASLKDSVYTTPLPALPELKEIILAGTGNKNEIGKDFLINNPQIERLCIMESGNFDMSVIEPLVNLKGLIIIGSDTVENFDLIRNHKELELLSVAGTILNNDLSLKELNHIRWITFNEDVTQERFNAFLEFHPGLEVVEIINNDTISNLKPLLKLRRLYGLTLTDTITDPDAVKSLKKLKYLSLPYKVLNNSKMKSEFRNSLPDTRIVANQGVCMGSGWLLLIIPLMLVFKAFTREKSKNIQGGH